YRPLIGYDKEEIITIARKIGTYSSDPGDTSCTVLPPRPVTKSEAGHIKEFMDRAFMEDIIREILKSPVKKIIKNGTIKNM
ncbi:MAG: tRNA 4-thiouridine(8) synthase ThiI, partial [Methanospirillum sp.]|nr:tRNA 4-thiouridine(8) synthase ThiI [Methanospirillum sp.]